MKKNKILETNNLNFSSQISTIKNQVTFFEKMKGKLEEENKYNKKIINNLTELNGDILNYLRKDGTPNINFYVKESNEWKDNNFFFNFYLFLPFNLSFKLLFFLIIFLIISCQPS